MYVYVLSLALLMLLNHLSGNTYVIFDYVFIVQWCVSAFLLGKVELGKCFCDLAYNFFT